MTQGEAFSNLTEKLKQSPIWWEVVIREQKLATGEVLARFDQLAARLASQNMVYSEDEVTADIATARLERAN